MKIRKLFLNGSILILALLLIFIVSYSILVYVSNKPPLEEIGFARKAISSAKNDMAGKYAAKRLRDAQNLYEQSIAEWQLQNEKFFLFRKYDRTRQLAINAYSEATSARDESQNIHTELKDGLKNEMLELKIKVNRFDKYYKNIPLDISIVTLSNKGKTAFLEAQIELKKGNFIQAKELVKKASSDLTKAEKEAYSILKGFYEGYPQWQEDVQLAYLLSKKQTVILVNKLDATCTVLKSEKEYKTFPAEFGPGWMGDKIKTGDKATPEGIYKVTSKKSGSKTKYHKALLLNYPNNEDKKRFATFIKAGKIPANSKIGGLIEIHGDGGKGVNWTDGCIALEDSEMDLLYNLCSVNTPVIIVGARQSLAEYLD